MKTRTVLNALFAFATAFAAAAPAFAGVDFLGETTLTRYQDRDFIHAGQCPSPMNRPVEAVKLQVLHRMADIDYVAVQYGNGAWDRLPVRERFAPGSESRWIDLQGGARCVERISIIGDTDGAPGLAKVRVWGRR